MYVDGLRRKAVRWWPLAAKRGRSEACLHVEEHRKFAAIKCARRIEPDNRPCLEGALLYSVRGGEPDDGVEERTACDGALLPWNCDVVGRRSTKKEAVTVCKIRGGRNDWPGCNTS